MSLSKSKVTAILNFQFFVSGLIYRKSKFYEYCVLKTMLIDNSTDFVIVRVDMRMYANRIVKVKEIEVYSEPRPERISYDYRPLHVCKFNQNKPY